MSWEEDFRRNIERTRQRIMEIAPDMLDLNAHRTHLDVRRDPSVILNSRHIVATREPTHRETARQQQLKGESGVWPSIPERQSNSRSDRDCHAADAGPLARAICSMTTAPTRLACSTYGIPGLGVTYPPLDPSRQYSPFFCKPGTRDQHNSLARIIASAEIGATILISTMIVGPLNILNEDTSDPKIWVDHPTIMAMCTAAFCRYCNVNFLYTFVEGRRRNPSSPNKPDQIFDAGMEAGMTFVLKKLGVKCRRFNQDNPITDDAENHCKFIYVSKTAQLDAAFPPVLHDVIAQSSGNMYIGDSWVWNDTLVTYHKPKIASAYRDAFQILWNATQGSTGDLPLVRSDNGVRSYFVPSTDWNSSPNPFADVLFRLARGPQSIIRLAMVYVRGIAGFTDYLDNVIDLIQQHVSHGTVVKIITSKTSEYMKLKTVGAEVRTGSLHNKYMLVSGSFLVGLNVFDPTSWRSKRLVLTGSLNLEGWRQADSALLIDVDSDFVQSGNAKYPGILWENYNENFEAQWADSEPT